MQAPRFELEVRGFGPGREGEKAPEELVIAGFLALGEEGVGVIGVFDILEAIVASEVAGNERVTVVEAEPIGRGCEHERLAGVVGGDGGAMGLQGKAKLPGGSPL